MNQFNLILLIISVGIGLVCSFLVGWSIAADEAISIVNIIMDINNIKIRFERDKFKIISKQIK